jgi:hypothetical protein
MQLIRFKEIKETSTNKTHHYEVCRDGAARTRSFRFPRTQAQHDFAQKIFQTSRWLMSWGMLLSLGTTGVPTFSIFTSAAAFIQPDRPAQVHQPNFEPSASMQLAQAVPLNLEGRYDGIAVRVMGIDFAPSSIVLRLELVNSSEIAIQLNSGSPGQGMVLQDDVGNQYSIVPPESNTSIGLLSGETLTGEYTFAGPVSSSATSLTLITNSQTGQTDIVPTIVPKVVVSGIPIQQR